MVVDLGDGSNLFAEVPEPLPHIDVSRLGLFYDRPGSLRLVLRRCVRASRLDHEDRGEKEERHGHTGHEIGHGMREPMITLVATHARAPLPA